MHALVVEGAPGNSMQRNTHSKLILRVHSSLAHGPGIVESLHVVGFVKAERKEQAEILGAKLSLLTPDLTLHCPERLMTINFRFGCILELAFNITTCVLSFIQVILM